MCSPAQCKPADGSFLDTLARLSAAEEFFDILDVAFDQQVVSVHRLHILKRFNALLDMSALRALEDGAQRVACRHALEKAYLEFASGQGLKDFKVFKDTKTGFVPLSSIRSVR
ncbi:nitrogenase-stabilizing/protective protein NifW [Magnetospirillum aberrantis]|uniref:Nitrogenase-stabilizing/protective protein NifW n=1 Tax=Magnetospirillum aberrantis SpK TaxID=908842 RepID=A0A7C9UU89_9PROT|nr:nitrogenase-stabilizing/protective protein NifW [Magnetospirillum aberrantis]NFV79129.1 nitrogenase [Magnetospirillum aberrantis SpK]